ncbi:hypothetical protein K501DRAFT_192332, partial [Backusella circina FSU 941]
LNSMGVYSKNFLPTLTAKLYKTFLRSSLEYGLVIACCSQTNLDFFNRCQDQHLCQLFGGRRTASAKVVKHMLNIPSLTERTHIPTFKFINRAILLPQATLLLEISLS